MMRPAVLFLGLVAGVAALLAADLDAYTGGWDDGAQNYNCGTSCHSGPTNHGTGVLVLSADKPSVVTGQGLVVTAQVTETQLGNNALVGVFLLRSTAGSADGPEGDGWEILQDPNGRANNYVQTPSPGAGQAVTLRWTLQAPATPGDYTLLARVHHGSTARNPLWEDSSSVTVTVTAIPPGVPIIDHAPVSVGYLQQDVGLEAWVVNATTGVFLHWRAAGQTNFSSVELTNTTEGAGARWRYEGAIPASATEGEIEYYLVATRDALYTDTPVFTVRIVPVPVKPDVSAWVAQILVGVECIAVLAVVASRYASRPLTKVAGKEGSKVG